MDDSDGRRLTFADGCIRTYGAATRLMAEMWERVLGEPMPTLSGSPKSRFREALGMFERELRATDGHGLGEGLAAAAAADPALADLLDGAADGAGDALRDIDDVPPNLFKQALYDEALERGRDRLVDIDMDVILRGAVARVMDELEWERRLNVGRNRHFPRMLQWCREVEDESTGADGCGFRIMNRSGRGRVADEPDGPGGLKIRIDGRLLR